MNFKNLFFAISFFVLAIPLFEEEQQIENHIRTSIGGRIDIDSPPCLRMYDAIQKYADMYHIPKKYAFGIAYKETTYRGPFDWKYNPKRTSCVGAIGPMQIMPSTADLVWKTQISKSVLMNNIEFNVHTSMKLLRKLHDRYADWKIVFGCYNTGKPLINQYAIDVYNHQPNWKLKVAKL